MYASVVCANNLTGSVEGTRFSKAAIRGDDKEAEDGDREDEEAAEAAACLAALFSFFEVPLSLPGAVTSFEHDERVLKLAVEVLLPELEEGDEKNVPNRLRNWGKVSMRGAYSLLDS